MEKKLDTTGKVCPFPLIDAKNAIDEIASKDTLTILFDCGQAVESLPRWSAEAGHTVSNFEAVAAGVWTISIQKA